MKAKPRGAAELLDRELRQLRGQIERIAAERKNFHYLTTLSRPHEGWEGLRGYVQEHVTEIVTQYDQTHDKPENAFGIHAYICGLNEMVSANRERLKSLEWERKQIIFERYD